MFLATFLSLALLPSGVAAADTVETNFENFNLGTVNGQPYKLGCPMWEPDELDCWHSAVPGDIPSLPHGYDQAVVDNSTFYPECAPPAKPSCPIPEFGMKSLRFSNAYNQFEAGPAEFRYQTYSMPTKEPAGETLGNTVYTAQFSFISTQPNVQRGLFAEVDPDNGEGARMSYIGLEDIDELGLNGIVVWFYEPEPDGAMVPYDLTSQLPGGTLPRDKPHTIKYWIKLVPGPENDLERIDIDGHDAGQCFTTWENYYRATKEPAGPVPSIDTLEFRSIAPWVENVTLAAGGGYLFDNVTITTAKGEGPPTCELPIEKQAEASTARPGGRVRYRITVRNRGRLSARNVLICDRIPSEMTFVSADRKLLGLGDRRCLLIPQLAPGQRVSFHSVLRVDANAPPGDVDNIVEETPGGELVPPPAPPAALTGLPPGAKTASIPPAAKAKAIVKVLAKRESKPPPVTG